MPPRIPEVHERVEPPLGQFWEPIRTDRAHRRRLQKLGAEKRRAAITIVHNEPVFLPIWLSYYSRFFAPEDIYVLDNDTHRRLHRRRRLRPHPGPPRLGRPHLDGGDGPAAPARADRGGYDVVLVTDVDEIVTPTPEWGTLGDYIDEFGDWWVNCIGYELIHMVDREEPDRPRAGRSSTSAATGSRTAPTTSRRSRPVRCHGCRASTTASDGQLNYDPDLRLIHLHRMDFEICRERHRVAPGARLERARRRQEGLGVVQPDDRGGRVRATGSTRTAASSRTACTSWSSGSPRAGRGLF